MSDDGGRVATGNGSIPNMDSNNATSESIARLQQEASIRKIRSKLEESKTHFMKDMEGKFACMIDDVIKEMQHNDLHLNEFKGLISDQHTEIWKNRPKAVQKEKGKRLGDKIFTARDSIFTCLYRVPHMKTIYHSFLVMLFMMVSHTAIHDYVTKGVLNFGQRTINNGMRGFWRGVGIWSMMQASVFLVYFGLKLWAQVRLTFRKNVPLRHLWDAVCLCLFVSFQLFFMAAATYAVIRLDLAFVAVASVLLEMTRMVMKMHAFVRTNGGRILDGKLKVDPEETASNELVRYPSLSQFTYYFFAPTFIYQDSYPRTSRIDWSFAIARLLEVVGVMFFMANIHERYIEPNFQNFGKEQITPGDLVVKLFSMILPGFLIFLSGFYCVLHAWLNFTAEVLRFSDRMYYKDWWTAHNYDSFYRNWNVVVHDWLYEYIYKDMFHYVFRGSKTASSITVFLVSAIIHEYILSIGLRFFLPVMFSFFGVLGVIVVFLTRKVNRTAGNLFLWFSLSLGNGLMVSLYAMESYARDNCPVNNDSWLNYFIPVILTCNGLK